MVKNLPAMQKTWVRCLGWEDPLEEGMATHSSILAWRIPMNRGAWWANSPWVTKSQTRLSNSAQYRNSILLNILHTYFIGFLLFCIVFAYFLSRWKLSVHWFKREKQKKQYCLSHDMVHLIWNRSQVKGRDTEMLCIYYGWGELLLSSQNHSETGHMTLDFRSAVIIRH